MTNNTTFNKFEGTNESMVFGFENTTRLAGLYTYIGNFGVDHDVIEVSNIGCECSYHQNIPFINIGECFEDFKKSETAALEFIAGLYKNPSSISPNGNKWYVPGETKLVPDMCRVYYPLHANYTKDDEEEADEELDVFAKFYYEDSDKSVLHVKIDNDNTMITRLYIEGDGKFSYSKDQYTFTYDAESFWQVADKLLNDGGDPDMLFVYIMKEFEYKFGLRNKSRWLTEYYPSSK